MTRRPVPLWLGRLDEPAITGIYLAYADLFAWIRARLTRARKAD